MGTAASVRVPVDDALVRRWEWIRAAVKAMEIKIEGNILKKIEEDHEKTRIAKGEERDYGERRRSRRSKRSKRGAGGEQEGRNKNGRGERQGREKSMAGRADAVTRLAGRVLKTGQEKKERAFGLVTQPLPFWLYQDKYLTSGTLAPSPT